MLKALPFGACGLVFELGLSPFWSGPASVFSKFARCSGDRFCMRLSSSAWLCFTSPAPAPAFLSLRNESVRLNVPKLILPPFVDSPLASSRNWIVVFRTFSTFFAVSTVAAGSLR